MKNKSSDIIIPENNISLEQLGLINQGLFRVDGELASRYNKILSEVFGYESDLKNFRVDKRGLSPELGDELKSKYSDKLEFGENYLNLGSANRYMIVVSPDQRNAPLVAPQTSYEDKLFDNVYKSARHTIEEITSSEALFGELNNGIAVFRSVEDLLQLRTISLSLDTLGGTSEAIYELKKMSENLGEDDNALNSEYINKMRSLVEKAGSIETRAISDIFPIKTEVHCFYVEFFRGVHCLRNFKNKDDIRGIFISHHHENGQDLGDEIINLDLHDEEVINVLHKYKFLKYNKDLIVPRIREIEDDLLLNKGLDVITLPEYKRKKEIHNVFSNLPNSWNQLNDLSRALANTSVKIEDIDHELDYETRLKLSEPLAKPEIINHMLAEIDPTDVRRVYEFNRRKFTSEFSTFPVNRQRYIVHSILTQMKGGSK